MNSFCGKGGGIQNLMHVFADVISESFPDVEGIVRPAAAAVPGVLHRLPGGRARWTLGVARERVGRGPVGRRHGAPAPCRPCCRGRPRRPRGSPVLLLCGVAADLLMHSDVKSVL